MKALKLLVIGMGVLIVLGTALLVYGLIENGGKLTKAEDHADPVLLAPSVPSAPMEADLVKPEEPLPPYNVKIPLIEGEDVDILGLSGNNLLIRVYYHGRNHRVVVINPTTGALTGTIFFDDVAAQEKETP